MQFIGIDLEGVLVPEIWVGLSKKTGLKDLMLTTKDIDDYNELMKIRINILNRNDIRAKELYKIAGEIKPFDGAVDFLEEMRSKYQVIILSDTFFNLSYPIFEKLNKPTVFCHKLLVNDDGIITGYKKCIENHKQLTIRFMNNLNYNTIAVGDSYNDLRMLSEAKNGILFKSTEEIINKNTNHHVCNNYIELKDKIFNIFDQYT